MRLNPHEQLLSFKPVNGTRPLRPRVKRSRSGCFNCRKIKKKCDEAKPGCTTCSQKGLQCVWPKNANDKLPAGYKIPRVRPVKTSNKKKNEKLVTENLDTIVRDSSEVSLDLIFRSPKLELLGDTLADIEDDIEDDIADDVSESAGSTDENYSLDLENVSRSPQKFLSHFTHDPDHRFMTVCINGFLESIGPQYTHPMLTTTATFSPFINKNHIIQKVAIACGCAFLSHDKPELVDLASKKYITAFNSLCNYVKKHEVSGFDDWLGAAFQLMCLCTKVAPNRSSAESVISLANSYNIIKARFANRDVRKTRNITEMEENERYNNQNISYDISDFKSDNLTMEIENSQLIEIGKSGYFESHFEKMFVESFIYNYCVSLLISENYQMLPNPFEVFKDFRYYLKTPIFNCDVAWMNNPVFGASLDAYELACKASYLFRNLNDPLMLVAAKKLYDIACFYPSPMIPSEIRIDSKKYIGLKASVLMAEIVAKVAKILLRKLIMPEITEHDPVIQKDLSTIFAKFRAIAPGSKVSAMASFPSLIAGSACVTEVQKNEIVEILRETNEITHGRHIFTILDALNISWGRGPKASEINTRGLDILFDSRVMSTVIL